MPTKSLGDEVMALCALCVLCVEVYFRQSGALLKLCHVVACTRGIWGYVGDLVLMFHRMCTCRQKQMHCLLLQSSKNQVHKVPAGHLVHCVVRYSGIVTKLGEITPCLRVFGCDVPPRLRFSLGESNSEHETPRLWVSPTARYSPRRSGTTEAVCEDSVQISKTCIRNQEQKRQEN